MITFFTITDEDVYESSLEILKCKLDFEGLSKYEKIWIVFLFPVIYLFAVLGLIIFGLSARSKRAKKRK